MTGLLQAWSDGDEEALNKLAPVVYQEPHQIACRCMAGERTGHKLQTTALINEAYLRLIDWKNVPLKSRAHFFLSHARHTSPIPPFPMTDRIS